MRTDLRALGRNNYLHVTVSSTADETVDDWTMEISLPEAIVGICGARSDALGSLTYRISPDPWTRRIPSGGQVEFGVLLG
ncbi:MAG: hypothetical protein AAGB11_05155 [Pseudomonadota bacterium]